MWYNDKKEDYQQAKRILENLKCFNSFIKVATHEQYVANDYLNVFVSESVLDTTIALLERLANAEYIGE